MDKSQYIPPKDWTPEQVQAKLQNLIDHVERLKDDWWDDDLKGLINVHGIFSPELARPTPVSLWMGAVPLFSPMRAVARRLWKTRA